ncbi:hypothetical protein SCUP515_10399 [Seiridium cupressi]
MANLGRSLKSPSLLSPMASRRPGMARRSVSNMSNVSEVSSAASSPGEFFPEDIIFSAKTSPMPQQASPWSDPATKASVLHLEIPGTFIHTSNPLSGPTMFPIFLSQAQRFLGFQHHHGHILLSATHRRVVYSGGLGRRCALPSLNLHKHHPLLPVGQSPLNFQPSKRQRPTALLSILHRRHYPPAEIFLVDTSLCMRSRAESTGATRSTWTSRKHESDPISVLRSLVRQIRSLLLPLRL